MDAPAAAGPGRSCPLHYRYGAAALADTRADMDADVLYVVGGLYGNRPALDALERLLALERRPVRVLFNGDFHWLDVAAECFADVQRRVLSHDALAGNVEAELVDGSGDAGCGCAYPADVPDVVVDRSNLIHALLMHTTRHDAHWRGELAALDFWRGVRVGDARVGVVHGDAHSLSGWSFDARALRDTALAVQHEDTLRTAQCHVFASSHTGLPALALFGGQRAIINNGAAGLPNFRGRRFGLVSRIALTAAPVRPQYGARIGHLHIDALALDYDHAAWLAEFTAQWPARSPAALNHLERIEHGPAWTPADATP